VPDSFDAAQPDPAPPADADYGPDGTKPGNPKLRNASYVFGLLAAAGFFTLFYELVWVERISGKQVFKTTFIKERVASVPVEPRPVAPARPGVPARPGRRPFPELKLEKLYEASKIGPYRLRPQDSPFRCSLDLQASAYDPQKIEEGLLKYTVKMTDASGETVWQGEETISRDSAGPGGEPSQFTMTVDVFDVEREGEYDFHPRVVSPGVCVHRAVLSLRRRVRVGSPVVVAVAAGLFLLSLLVAISCSKAYDLSRGAPAEAGWSHAMSLGDSSLAERPASADQAESGPQADADEEPDTDPDDRDLK